MQDIEFTIQQGKLYMLQTRNGKRTAPAALKIAVEMAQEAGSKRCGRCGQENHSFMESLACAGVATDGSILFQRFGRHSQAGRLQEVYDAITG